jgi:hypothetical protein
MFPLLPILKPSPFNPSTHLKELSQELCAIDAVIVAGEPLHQLAKQIKIHEQQK